MFKLHKFMLSTLVLVIMLTLIPAGTVLAQENEIQNRRGVLMERVSEILNIEQQTLEDAFKQALATLPKEDLESRLQEMVSSGVLTQGQANQHQSWLESRPDIPNVGPRGLKKLLDEGKITQEQMEQYKAWLKARPDIPKLDRKEARKQAANKLQENRDALMAEVAKILNIDQQELEDAFKQAISETRENALDARLQELVNNGTLTQQQADAYKSWIEARPDIPRIWPARR